MPRSFTRSTELAAPPQRLYMLVLCIAFRTRIHAMNSSIRLPMRFRRHRLRFGFSIPGHHFAPAAAAPFGFAAMDGTATTRFSSSLPL